MLARSARRLSFALLLLASCGDGCGCEPPPVDPPLAGTGLQVTSPLARACDAVFRVTADEVPSVTFGDAVRGQAIPKAPRFAVSFVARTDASLVGQPIAAFTFASEGNARPTLEQARCFDPAGAAIPGTPLTVAQ